MMKLLPEEELIWSSIVANSNMNRKRNLVGINSYEKDIHFDIIQYLEDKIELNNTNLQWIDLCCGEGKALIQAYTYFKKINQEKHITFEGIDLVDMFFEHKKSNHLILKTNSIICWESKKKYDLITCVHGLHYVGDKLLAISKIAHALKKDGLFIGNIDFDDIKNSKNQSLKKDILKILKQYDIEYHSRKKLLLIKGYQNIEFEYSYLGANDKAGQNYTGQEIVHSFYS